MVLFHHTGNCLYIKSDILNKKYLFFLKQFQAEYGEKFFVFLLNLKFFPH